MGKRPSLLFVVILFLVSLNICAAATVSYNNDFFQAGVREPMANAIPQCSFFGEDCIKNEECCSGYCSNYLQCGGSVDVLIVALRTNLDSVYSGEELLKLENKIQDFQTALRSDSLSSAFIYLDDERTGDINPGGQIVTDPQDWIEIDAVLDTLIPSLGAKYLIIIGGYYTFPQAPIGSETGSDDAYGDIDGDGNYLPDIAVGRFPDPVGGDIDVLLNGLDTATRLHYGGGLDLSSYVVPSEKCGDVSSTHSIIGSCLCSVFFGIPVELCGPTCGYIESDMLSGKKFAIIEVHGPGPVSDKDYFFGSGFDHTSPSTISNLEIKDATWMTAACGGGYLNKLTTDSSLVMTFLEAGGAVYMAGTDNNCFITPQISLSPSFSPDGSEIVFLANTGGPFLEVYLMEVDGSNKHQITFGPIKGAGNCVYPLFSPDGRKVLFLREYSMYSYDICIMDQDGSNLNYLTTDAVDGINHGYTSFSPDSSKVLFASSDPSEEYDIYLMNVDGSNMQRLTNSPGNDIEPSFSPDGSKIVFVSARDRPDSYWPKEIYIMNSDGSNQQRLTNTPDSDNYRPFFSPDGSKIVFVSRRDGPGHIYLMNSDGSDQQRLTEVSLSNDYPSVSADGSKIIFFSERQDIDGVYIMNIDGTNQQNLAQYVDFSRPFFSPDGSKIAFVSDRSGSYEVYIMNSDGSDQQKVTTSNDCENMDLYIGDLLLEITKLLDEGTRIGHAYQKGKQNYLNKHPFLLDDKFLYTVHINILYGDPTLLIKKMWGGETTLPGGSTGRYEYY